MHLSFKRLALTALMGSTLALSPAALASPTACGDHAAIPDKAVPADAAKADLAIAGMTCDGCAKGIRSALMGIDGVYAADVSYADGKAAISYDAKKVKVDDLVAAIAKAGYKASPKG